MRCIAKYLTICIGHNSLSKCCEFFQHIFGIVGDRSMQRVRWVIGSGWGAGRWRPSGGVSQSGVVSLSCRASGVGGVSSTPSNCGMASPLEGVDGGDGFPGRDVHCAVAVAVTPPGERAILRFLSNCFSIDAIAAGFAAWMCWVTPAARYMLLGPLLECTVWGSSCYDNISYTLPE